MKDLKIGRFVLLLVIMVAIFAATFMILRANLNYNDENHHDHSEIAEKPRIELSWWGNDERHKYTMEGVAHFEKEHDIDVDLSYGEWNGYPKRTKVWMESNTEADVMQINYAWLDTYSKDGEGYYDLYQLADVIDLSQFTEEELAFGEKNGKLNALPIAMNTHVFYYNQDMLDECKLSLPETWDDLFVMGEVLGADGKYVLGMSKKQVMILLAAYYEQRNGKPMFQANGTFMPSQEELADLLEFYKKMIDGHVLMPIDQFDRSKYMSGEVVGTMCWISDTKIYYDGLSETGVHVTRAYYPKLPGATRSGWYVKPATMWAISAKTEHPKESAELLNFLLNDPYMVELQQTEKGVPVSRAALRVLLEKGLAATEEYKATEAMKQRSDELNLINPNLENEDLIDAVKAGADEYLFGKMTAEESAVQIRNDILSILSGSN